MNRWDIINNLITEYDCKSYLEIGVQNGECFNRVECFKKTWVDPFPSKHLTPLNGYGCDSDTFFKHWLRITEHDGYDIVFIDGLHHSDQVERDIANAWNQGAKVIVLHDCNPPGFQDQVVPRQNRVWYGDVWRAFVGFRQKYPEVKSWCHNQDCGVGVIICGGDIEPGFITSTPWKDFEVNRKELLNLI